MTIDVTVADKRTSTGYNVKSFGTYCTALQYWKRNKSKISYVNVFHADGSLSSLAPDDLERLSKRLNI